MEISPRLCRLLNFVALGGCLFCLYGRGGPENVLKHTHTHTLMCI